MDVDLALVSALQLRELLQQHSPQSSQVQDLANECKKLLAIGEEALKTSGSSDHRMQQACKDLDEALTFFYSISAADEDLAKQQQLLEKKQKQQQQPQASSRSTRPGRGSRREGENSKKQHRGRTSSGRTRKKDKAKGEAEDHRAAAAAEQQVDSLLVDWPTIDFSFEGNAAVPSFTPLEHEILQWGSSGAKDSSAVLPAGLSAPPAATLAEKSASSRHGKTRTSRRQAKRSSSSSSSRSSGSSGSSSTRSRGDSSDGEGAEIASTRRRRPRNRGRFHSRHLSNGDSATAALPMGSSETQADGCCCICISSLRAVFMTRSTARPFYIDSAIYVPSQSVEAEAQNTSELGVVTSSSDSSSGSNSTTKNTRELQVTWQQPITFAVRMRPTEDNERREGSSSFANPLECLQQEGMLRFLIRRADNRWPAFTAQLPLNSLTCGSATTYQAPVFSKEGSAADHNVACGYLCFSVSAELGKPAGAPQTVVPAGSSDKSVPNVSHGKVQKRSDVARTIKGQLTSQRQYCAEEKAKTHEADLTALLKLTNNENAALQQQNNFFQMQIQQQQQAMMQQQQHIQALQAHVQKLTAQLNEASQRIASTEMQQQQSLQHMQQQREAASRAAAAEVAQLQQQVLHLEGLVKVAEEEKKAHRREIRNYRIEAEEHNRELQALRDEQRSVDRKAKEQERTIAELTTLLTNARSRIRNERQRNEGLVGKLEAACETESSLKAELQASQEMAEEGRRQLLSLTWGLEAPPVFSGLPEATSKSSRQPGIDQQRHRETQRGSSVDLGGQRQYSPTNTDWVDKRMQYSSKATLDPVSSLSITPLRWNDVRILRRVVPPIQPCEDSWQAALLLAMQEGYSRIMLEPADPSEQPWGGILLKSPLVNVSWFCTVRLGSKGRMHECLPTWLSGEVAAAASFVASITLNVTSLPSINVALEKEVIEGGRAMVSFRPSQEKKSFQVSGELEVFRPSRDTPILLISVLTSDSQVQSLRLKLPLPSAVFCTPLRLSWDVFATKWRSLEMQEDAQAHVPSVLLDMVPARIRSAVSLCALGKRFHVMPIDESGPRKDLITERPGVMCIHASGAFPSGSACIENINGPSLRSNMHSENEGGSTACLVELSVKRNTLVGTEQQIHSAAYAGRQPSGLLRVRSVDSSLRSNILEVLLQLLLTPKQILGASSTSLLPKTVTENV